MKYILDKGRLKEFKEETIIEKIHDFGIYHHPDKGPIFTFFEKVTEDGLLSVFVPTSNNKLKTIKIKYEEYFTDFSFNNSIVTNNTQSKLFEKYNDGKFSFLEAYSKTKSEEDILIFEDIEYYFEDEEIDTVYVKDEEKDFVHFLCDLINSTWFKTNKQNEEVAFSTALFIMQSGFNCKASKHLDYTFYVENGEFKYQHIGNHKNKEFLNYFCKAINGRWKIRGRL